MFLLKPIPKWHLKSKLFDNFHVNLKKRTIHDIDLSNDTVKWCLETFNVTFHSAIANTSVRDLKNVRHQEWTLMSIVAMMVCRWRFIDDNRCTTPTGDIDDGGGCACVGAVVCGTPPSSPPFCYKLKTALKSSLFLLTETKQKPRYKPPKNYDQPCLDENLNYLFIISIEYFQ